MNNPPPFYPINLGKKPHCQGFTLLDAIIAMVMLTIIAGGIISGAIQIRKMSEADVWRNTAHSVASGFMEQIIATDYPVIETITGGTLDQITFRIRDGGTITVPVDVPVSPDPNDPNPVFLSGPHGWQGPLDIPVSVDEQSDEEIFMPFWLQVSMQPTPDGLLSTRIIVRYRWTDPWTRQTLESDLRLVRAAATFN